MLDAGMGHGWLNGQTQALGPGIRGAPGPEPLSEVTSHIEKSQISVHK